MWRILCLLLLLAAPATCFAQEVPASKAETPALSPAEEAMHKELRALRERVVKAVNEEEIDALLEELHPNVVVVWQNGEISRGKEEVRAYYERNLGLEDSPLESYTVEPEIGELTRLYGDNAGIVYGTTLSRFNLRSGGVFELNGPWSATLVKEDGKWLIASFHASAPLFDNPLLKSAQGALVWGVVIASLVAAVVGVGIGFLLGRNQGGETHAEKPAHAAHH